MKTVLIINHKVQNCGVYQIGKRIFNVMAPSHEVKYFYKEVTSYEEYKDAIKEIMPNYVLYNYYNYTMSWLTPDILHKTKPQKHLLIYHEKTASIIKNYDYYIFLGTPGDDHPIIDKTKCVLLPRPLLSYAGGYPRNNKFTVGSFGFGFWNKGMHTLTNIVNTKIPGAVLNLHIPNSYFGDPSGAVTDAVLTKCKAYAKKITLNITREFLAEEQILAFLATNDINIFNYDIQGTDGIASVIDYALSVKRPLALTDCAMFRHIKMNDILLEKNSIMDIYNKGVAPLEPFYSQWAPNIFRTEMNKLFLRIPA